jgi:choline-sulfatase
MSEMNVLWLMADQMRGDCPGFMGHPIVQTPHLDQLAAKGTVFENAYTVSSLCTPSRTSYFTSRYVHEHGAWWNGIPTSRDFPLLPELLQDAGYHTGLIGKLHFNPQERPFGFDHKELHEERLPTELSAYDRFLAAQDPPAPHPAQATDWQDRPVRVGVCEMEEELEETRWVADRSCAFLREQGDEPFFLYASFLRPHSPYNPLERYLRMYDDIEIEAPAFDPEEWDRLPPRVRVAAETVGWSKASAEDFAAVRRHYYALCTQVDYNVGRILRCLEEEGLADSTIVVFASDHGDFVGEHGGYGKRHLWDGSLHVPLVIHDPRRTTASRYPGLVASLDVMPTLLAMLDLPVMPEFRGKSLLPVMEDPALPHRDAVFSEFAHYEVHTQVREVLAACQDPNSVSVHTDRWKYIYYAGERDELYDLAADPGERWNLIDDPDTLPVQMALRDLILQWRVRMDTNDYSLPQSSNSYFSNYFGT